MKLYIFNLVSILNYLTTHMLRHFRLQINAVLLPLIYSFLIKCSLLGVFCHILAWDRQALICRISAVVVSQSWWDSPTGRNKSMVESEGVTVSYRRNPAKYLFTCCPYRLSCQVHLAIKNVKRWLIIDRYRSPTTTTWFPVSPLN